MTTRTEKEFVPNQDLNGLIQSIIGTGNQIIVTVNADETITLSLPQDIGYGSDVVFGSLTGTNLTASRLAASDANKKVVSVSSLTSWISQTLKQVLVADDGDGTITLSLPQDIDAGAIPTFGGLTLTGALTQNTVNVSTDYTILSTDDIIFCNTDNGSFEIFLPAGLDGKHLKIVSCGTSDNKLTVTPGDTEMVLGEDEGDSFVMYDSEIIDIHFDTEYGWY